MQRNYAAMGVHGGAVVRFAATQWRGVAPFRGNVHAVARKRLVALILLYEGNENLCVLLRFFLEARAA